MHGGRGQPFFISVPYLLWVFTPREANIILFADLLFKAGLKAFGGRGNRKSTVNRGGEGCEGKRPGLGGLSSPKRTAAALVPRTRTIEKLNGIWRNLIHPLNLRSKNENPRK